MVRASANETLSVTHIFVTGDVIYLEVFGRPIVILNSIEATSDLFEGRFTMYSDRPEFPFARLYVRRPTRDASPRLTVI